MSQSIKESARIQYTLPGYQPELKPEEGGLSEESAGISFRNRVRTLPAQVTSSWKSALGVDKRPSGPTSFDPPPKPPSFETGDAASERQRWQEILWQRSPQPRQTTNSNDNDRINRMLASLRRAQALSDAVLAHSAAEESLAL
jgi:hypothetical protein